MALDGFGIIPRLATCDDIHFILDALIEVACYVPVNTDGPIRRQKLEGIIQGCIAHQRSLIVDCNGKRAAGFLLCEPRNHPTMHIQLTPLHIAYGGVRKAFWRNGIFKLMISETKRFGFPLTAEVKRTNKSGMTKILECLGFIPTAQDDGNSDIELLWLPAGSESLPVAKH
jgi:hypothetical protein